MAIPSRPKASNPIELGSGTADSTASDWNLTMKFSPAKGPLRGMVAAVCTVPSSTTRVALTSATGGTPSTSDMNVELKVSDPAAETIRRVSLKVTPSGSNMLNRRSIPGLTNPTNPSFALQVSTVQLNGGRSWNT